MYSTISIDYHYYYQLTDKLNDEVLRTGKKVVQILEIVPSGDPERMHKATVLLVSG